MNKLKGYHASNHKISKLSYIKLFKAVTNHNNGALGLWCALSPHWISSFGKFRYTVTIEGKGFNLSVNELLAMSKESKEYHRDFMIPLLEDGYTHINIIESNGKSEMFILINFDLGKIKPTEP